MAGFKVTTEAILLAIVGIVLSYIPPGKESHLATTVVLIIAGLLGSAVLSLNRIRGERPRIAPEPFSGALVVRK